MYISLTDDSHKDGPTKEKFKGKKESFFRKFKWRIIRRDHKEGEELETDYIIERKEIFCKIPLWWSFTWNIYHFDSVNCNIKTFKTYDEAFDALKYLMNETSYFTVLSSKTNSTVVCETGAEPKTNEEPRIIGFLSDI